MNRLSMNNITVPEKISNERVDAVIAAQLESISRSSLKNRIDLLRVNGFSCRLSKKVSTGDYIEYELNKDPEINIIAEDIELDIIYEDENVFVINKPVGMVVHPAAGNYSGTMAQAIMYKLQNSASDFNETDTRPGIVHRLDKDTSGIIIAAKNTKTLEYLSAQFRNRESSKTYLAIINGCLPQKNGCINTLISRDRNNRKKMTWKTEHGKSAVTVYRVLCSRDGRSFIAMYPKTGRTHQLRVHMLSMNTPILGDPVYSRKTGGYPLMLHAYKLRIKLPGDTANREFRAPLPDRFKSMLINHEDMD